MLFYKSRDLMENRFFIDYTITYTLYDSYPLTLLLLKLKIIENHIEIPRTIQLNKKALVIYHPEANKPLTIKIDVTEIEELLFAIANYKVTTFPIKDEILKRDRDIVISTILKNNIELKNVIETKESFYGSLSEDVILVTFN